MTDDMTLGLSSKNLSPVTTLTDTQSEALIASILSEAQLLGASAAEAALSIGSGLSVTVRLGEVETIEHNRDKGIGITVYFGQRKGTASTSDFSAAAIRETVRAASNIAKFTAEDDCSGLADASLMARNIPDLDLFHPWALPPEQAIAIAQACEDAARAVDARITNSEGASLSSHQGLHIYANSHGFIGASNSTRHSLSCAVIGQDASGGMQRDYWFSVARDQQGLDTPVLIGQRAAERTLRRLDARRLETCQVPVLFASEIATSLLGHFISAIRGGNIYRKSSFLVDQLGKQIFPDFVHIHERPHLKKALGSAPFDGEGVATQARDWVSGGVLQGYVLDSYAARKLGMQTTGNAGGVHNLLIDSGTHDLSAMLKIMDRGLLVTELIGMGVSTLTGDYSRGAAGFWVEHGELQYPVEEITIAGNLREMFMQIAEVGNDVETRGNLRSGSILIENMTIAGE